jgi:uncharacterized membrane protein
MATNVVGLFDDRDAAQAVVQDLMNEGFSRESISVVATDPAGKFQKSSVTEDGNLAGEGAVSGATSGALVGGIFGLLVGVGALAFPAIGLVAAGPLSGLLTGAAIGGLSGGVIGGLIGLGIPEEHAHTYAEGIRRGGVLVTVQADDARADRAADIMERDGAVDIEERSAAYRSQGFEKYDHSAPVYSESQMAEERARYAAAAGATTGTTAATTTVGTGSTATTGTFGATDPTPTTAGTTGAMGTTDVSGTTGVSAAAEAERRRRIRAYNASTTGGGTV